jgi:aspartokinase
MIVSKFGGTSVADREAIERLAAIVAARRGEGVLVVVSALAGISDALISTVDAAARGDLGETERSIAAIAARHHALAEDLGVNAGALEATLGELSDLARGVSLVRETTGWMRARLVGAGELLSSRIVAARLGATWLDAREVVRTAGVDPERDPPILEKIQTLGYKHPEPDQLGGARAEGHRALRRCPGPGGERAGRRGGGGHQGSRP